MHPLAEFVAHLRESLPEGPHLALELAASLAGAIGLTLWARRGTGRGDGALRAFHKLAGNRAACFVLVALVPVAVRLAILPWWGAPVPQIHDDFTHLLVADTFLHARFTNPPHPLARLLQTFYVVQRPTYSAMYPPGQGAMLALGILLTGHPWTGICLAIALMCAAVYWMLLAWIDPPWALLGGLFTGLAYGVTTEWMNCYYAGVPAAVGGALVFGALPRLLRRPTAAAGLLLGVGGGMIFLIRPWECVSVAGISLVALVWYLTRPRLRGERLRLIGAAACCLPGVVLALGVTLWHDWRVTGDPFTMPYQLAQKQYGTPQSLLFQKIAPAPRNEIRELDDIAQRYWEVRSNVATPAGYLRHLGGMAVEFFSFFIGFHFLAVVPGLVLWRRRREVRLPAAMCLAGLLPSFLYGWFYTRYYAPYVCVLMLLFLLGLQAMKDLTVRSFPLGRAILAYVAIGCVLVALRGPVGRIVGVRGFVIFDRTHRSAVEQQLLGTPGRHLVFVRYGAHHSFMEQWIANGADVDGSRIVWARALGPAADQTAREYWKGRSVWAVYPDESPVRLVRDDEGRP